MNSKHTRSWRLLAAALLTTLLAACGGGSSSSGSGYVRVVNATVNHPSLDLLVNAAVSISGITKDNASGYVSVAEGAQVLQLNDAGAAIALTNVSPTITKDQHFTMLVYESSGAIKTSIVNDENGAPAAGAAVIRISDLAPDAGAVDVYVTDPGTSLATLSTPTFALTPSSLTTAFLSFGTGTYRVRVTGAGDPTDLRLDIPALALTSTEVDTVILTPTTGGVLVDGGSLPQQGTYAAARNTNARVRLAAALSGGASVGANAGAVVVGVPTTSPAVGSYVTVPASNTLSVSVNGASVQVPTSTLAAGSDSTLLVYGSPGAPVVSVIADDNHLPSSVATLKMRLVNGITGAITPLTLTANFGVVASNVQPGAASGYGVVSGSTAVRLDVTAPAGVTPIYSESALNIPNNDVFTLFMLGDASTPTHVLRRDR